MNLSLSPRRLALALLLPLAATALLAAPAKRKIIIDQDAYGPGGSNMQAILMAVQAPDVEVLGITIISGDGWEKENVAHTLRMLELVGRTDIPVVPGATVPLVNTQAATKRWETIYGKIPYKGCWMEEWPSYDNAPGRIAYHGPDVVPPLPEGDPTTQPLGENAAAFMVRKVREFPGQVTILAMGPFTNVAIACALDPQFASNAKELVAMAGSFSPQYPKKNMFALEYIYNPREEFNIRFDPEAAVMALHAPWRKITVIPLDATTQTEMTQELVDAAKALKTPAAAYVARYPMLSYPLWDEVATGIWLDPTLVTRSEELSMDFDLDKGANYGATLSWMKGNGPGLGEPLVTVVWDIDVKRLDALFVDLIARPPAPAK